MLGAVAMCWSLAACGGGGGGGGNNATPPAAASASGLNVTITGASIESDTTTVVRFRLTDGQGQPLSADGVRIRLVIAVLEADTDEYRDYVTTVQKSPVTGVSAVQAAAENTSAGTLDDLGDGAFQYTFGLTLPDDFDRDASHRVAIFADTTILGVAYVSNAVFDFVPSGGHAPAVREVVRTQDCNTCHDPLEAHGGTRRDVRLCITCHSTQITDPATGVRSPHIDPDTGHNIGFPELIHKIHRGENLPSVEAGTPYQIIGFMQGVTDFSHVAFPQDIRNCDKCHGGAAQGEWFMTRPSRLACGSCHDDVNFASGENHGGGPQPNDGSCSACHLPQTGHEFDLSVAGSHVIPAHSSQVPGVRFEIVSVTSHETGAPTVAPGEHPVVTFRITTATGGAFAPSALNSLSLTLAGSTTDYSIEDYDGNGVLVPGDPSSPWTPGAETFKQESPAREAEGSDGSGAFRYTFHVAIPPNATGTYAIGIEGYKCTAIAGANQAKGGTNCSGSRDLNGNGREDPGEVFDEIRDAGPNDVFYFPVTDPAPVPRRTVVTIEQCRVCHGVFSKDFNVHGGTRNDTEYCATCHNPSNDTLSRQLPPVGATAMTSPVDFKIMIHKIHRGENLTTPYLLYGRLAPQTFPNHTEVPIDFSELLFPGDLRDCEACHRPASYVLAPGHGVLGPNVLPPTTRTFLRGQDTKTVLDVFTTPVTIAVCTSCHDDVHFDTGENHPAGPQPETACTECHGIGRPLSVERTHFPGLPPEERIQRPN
jgi:OmcA/MtrC family decaheme c-type cytochrome